MKSDDNCYAMLLNNIISSVKLDGRKSLGESEVIPGEGRWLSDLSPKVVF